MQLLDILAYTLLKCISKISYKSKAFPMHNKLILLLHFRASLFISSISLSQLTNTNSIINYTSRNRIFLVFTSANLLLNAIQTISIYIVFSLTPTLLILCIRLQNTIHRHPRNKSVQFKSKSSSRSHVTD